jgi:ribosomal protein L32
LPNNIFSVKVFFNMSVRMRHTRAHTRNRRSHHALKEASLTRDKETGSLARRHRVSPITGVYKGKQIIDVQKKAPKNVKEVKTDKEAEKEEKEVKETKPKAKKKTVRKVVKKEDK